MLTTAEYATFWSQAKLNEEQEAFVKKILKAAEIRKAERLSHAPRSNVRPVRHLDPVKRLHFLEGDGGTGKTYTLNVIMSFNLYFSIRLYYIGVDCCLEVPKN